MADLTALMAWTFTEEVPVPEEIKDLLIDGEVAEVAYKTIRDVAVVTNKRFIIADKQGLTGKKVESTQSHSNRLLCIPVKMRVGSILTQKSNYGQRQENSN